MTGRNKRGTRDNDHHHVIRFAHPNAKEKMRLVGLLGYAVEPALRKTSSLWQGAAC
jgi:hypothetical protein